MNICHVINDLSRGGAETHLLSLVKIQIKEGHKVSVILLGNDLDNFISLEEEFNLLDIGLIRFKGPKKIQGFNPFSLIEAIKIFNNGEFDIIHSHSPRSNLLAHYAKKYSKHNNKHIITIHGKYGTYLQGNKQVDKIRSYFISSLTKIWEQSQQVIVISESIQEWLETLNPKISPVVIKYGIEIPLVDNIKSSNKFTIGFLGKLNQNKGIEDLLSVYKEIEPLINSSDLNIRLLVGGVGPKDYVNKLKQSVEGRNVNFLGYVSDRKDFFSSLDLFVFPSYSEGLGLVLLEAMAHGVLSITRDVTPMNKIIKDDETGFLFKNNNDFRDKIFNIIKIDSNNVKQLQNNASETIKNSYSIIQMYSKINKVYNN